MIVQNMQSRALLSTGRLGESEVPHEATKDTKLIRELAGLKEHDF